MGEVYDLIVNKNVEKVIDSVIEMSEEEAIKALLRAFIRVFEDVQTLSNKQKAIFLDELIGILEGLKNEYSKKRGKEDGDK